MLVKNCLYCFVIIEKPDNESLKNWIGRHKFCSRGCLAKYYQKGKNTRFTKERHYVPPTAIKPKQNLSPNTQFKKGFIPWNKGLKGVGPPPWNKGKSHMPREKHPMWKGGVTTLSESIRHCTKYKEWRKRVFDRDNYTCVMCGSRSSKKKRVVIHVDHIKPFYKIRDDNKIQTIEEAIKCEEFWLLENGRTLCIDCHKKTPTYKMRVKKLKNSI